MNKHPYVLLILLLNNASVYAHQDQILSVRPDGSIPGIPASFGHVNFNVKDLGTAHPQIKFQVANHRTVIPSCLTRLIRSKNLSDIELRGSWYHDETSLPYYVSVQFFDHNNNHQHFDNSSYEFLFNLHDAKLIEVKRFEADGSGGGHYSDVTLCQ